MPIGYLSDQPHTTMVARRHGISIYRFLFLMFRRMYALSWRSYPTIDAPGTWLRNQ